MKLIKITIAVITSLILWLGLIGWCMDVVKFTHCDFKKPLKAEILYGVGAISPLGCVIGYMEIDDKCK